MILIACEFSGTVRDAFIELGHEAISCDLEPADGPHIQGDVRLVLDQGWDLMIAHPPCTYLATSGNAWTKPSHPLYHTRMEQRRRAAAFFMELINAPIPRIAVENPVSVMSTQYRKPDQIIQPYQFGHYEMKRTCLWLKNLPPLEPTDEVNVKELMHQYKADIQKIDSMPPSADRAKIRSLTYKGVAKAMAEQWGKLL